MEDFFYKGVLAGESVNPCEVLISSKQQGKLAGTTVKTGDNQHRRPQSPTLARASLRTTITSVEQEVRAMEAQDYERSSELGNLALIRV